MKKIYIGTLYRFGYDLTVAAETEKAARSALVKEYNRAYKMRNNCKPSSEEIRNRNEDMEIQEFIIGQVEWL